MASLFSSAAPMRPLVLHDATTRVSVHVPASPLSAWVTSQVVARDFQDSIVGKDTPAPVADEEEEPSVPSIEPQVTLLAQFLSFVADRAAQDASSELSEVLFAAYNRFNELFLSTINVHSLVQSFDPEVRAEILKSYFKAFATAREQLGDKVQIAHPSALLEAAKDGSTELYALFGGQGVNEHYFNELQLLYDTYTPFVAPIISEITDLLISLGHKADNNGYTYYSQGLDLLSWLDGSSPRPSVEYLASIPLSLPLIGVAQLAQYVVSCRVTDLSPAEMRERFKGATGHSQGVISAVAIASSSAWSSLYENILKAVKQLFYIGLRGQEGFPLLSIDPKIVSDSIENNEGVPTPMLSINGLGVKALEGHIKKVNSHLPSNSQIGISLHNGPTNFVVTAPAKALYGLVTALRKVMAPAGLDQSKVPFSKRKAVFTMRFLPVNVPYHSHYLEGATQKVEKDLGEELWDPKALAMAIYHTEDGSDLRSSEISLTTSLCDQIFTKPIHWVKACNFPSTATHAIDFGPGGNSGIGPLTSRAIEGRGVRIVVVGEKGKAAAEFYDATKIRREPVWAKEWSPKLVKTLDGKVHIDTPFSRLLGKPPIMVAGMTPSTVGANLVAATLDAGFHIELAGGGHYNPKALRAKVAEIQRRVKPGVGITLNALYINQRQFSFQFPLWQEMRKEGLPIEGFCVAAGIPSSEKATEIINALKEAGIKHIAFKPGSVEGIRQVVNIAAANPDYPIIMQWTGGRAGGHHSCEDFHQPIIATYPSIRQNPNISLIAGSGFGGAEDVWPYLSGEWSVKMFGLQPMPFDGVLYASRVMVAKEADTSASVKQLIVDAPGVDDAQWEGTYDKPTGGILTVRSELGEPIHKIATRGVKLWREFDDTVFAQPREKRAAWLENKRDYVIDRLNKDFNKPWFGEKSDGTVVADIGKMTYEEITKRMVRLMYVVKQDRWIDVSLRNLVGDWLRRVEERFAGVDGIRTKESLLQSFSDLDKPLPTIESFFNTYPRAKTQLVAAEDKAFFLAICQRPGQKPVPFIPILDNNFEVWFKKDSLWAAEDVEAVFDQDPQRVCILQGPMAVKHATVVDEPIKDMLGNIEALLVKKILKEFYNNDESKVPEIDFIGAKPGKPKAGLVSESVSGDVRTLKVGKNVPALDDWLEVVAGANVSWLRAALTSVNVVQGAGYISNPFRRIFNPRAGQTVMIKSENGKAISVTVYGAARSFGPHAADFKAVELTFNSRTNAISLVMNEERRGVSVPLHFAFAYHPEQGYAPIHEVVEGRNKSIKDFYWRLWFGDDEKLPSLKLDTTFTCDESKVDALAVQRFCDVVGNQGEAFKSARNEKIMAPMDFAIVLGWQSVMKAIFPDDINGDLLKLVHLSNGFRMMDGVAPLRAGDACSAEARVVSVINSDSGKTVKVKGYVLRGGEPVIEISSSFLYRGKFTDYENTFETIDESDYVVELSKPTSVGILQAKPWFEWDDDSVPLDVGTTLTFKTKSELRYKDKSTFSSVKVSGAAFIRDSTKALIQVATIDYEAHNLQGNPVIEYLKRHGTAVGNPTPLESGYSLIEDPTTAVFTTPATNEPYSKISGDFNPIHVNPYFSDLASLPGTITHGMWSSAATRKYLESVVADNHPERVVSYQVGFVGMVLPGDEIQVKLTHTAMRDGKKVVKVEAFNQRGEKVIDGSAEVLQPPTTYVFTGQGSQEVGMGMELYNNSEVARAVWDAADAHLTSTYGFSIVDIVKNNPKELTIHFGGIKGQAIRQRYMDLTYDIIDESGRVKTLPLFGDIDLYTTSYTFSHPQGLLFATQYTQIALVVTEKAAFDDMKAKGLIDQNASFAGHSLGEYSALAAIADVLPISSLADVVFFRGITMQRAVQRDAEGKSQYAMMAANPSRVGKTFNEMALREIVDTISQQKSVLLQIVNLNVANQQYVCAGELRALATLTNVLNMLKIQKIDLEKLSTMMSIEEVKEQLAEIIEGCWDMMKKKEEKDGSVILDRGFATIPLPGIDVPFHSRYLWPGVLSFRNYLVKKIDPSQLNPDRLIGKYIPNLIAEPFEVSKAYVQKIFDQTASPRMEAVLGNWEKEAWESPSQRQRLAYNILTECLAYQFASPVRWIETQDVLFTYAKFERLIEVGPSPVLSGMATRTLKAKYEAQDGAISLQRQILCHAKNQKEVYYAFEDEAADEAPAAAPASTAAAAPAPVAAPVVAAPAPVAASAGPAAAVEDVPPKAVDTVRVIVAQKLKKQVSEVPLSKSLKELSGGKSTLQNEILGDLQVEFASAPEKGEDLPLDELGAALSVGYAALGKHSMALTNRMIASKFPGGFNITAARAHLNKQWGLGPLRTDSALFFGILNEPPKRLGSEAEAKAFLDQLAQSYASYSGISLSSGAAAGGAGGAAGGGAVMNSEEFDKFVLKQEEHAKREIELLSRYLGKDPREGEKKADEEKATAEELQAKLDAIKLEHGDAYIDGITPVFSALKARTFDSSWNWVRQSSIQLFYDIIHGDLDPSTVFNDPPRYRSNV
ncbi:fatty acid synthase subunit beta, fungi type [Cryptococcus gattii EJB2]|uniref:Fatty acid synthase subunit beta, fungi type n=1 Tax=Cryptococcus gattii EJB2 TaxID=1296103 RepID=A0ABR5BRJ0_9TREE|nr:fatty acid synthase subunit beta, fungi type [Cryptococcus gattii EJB2]